MSQPVWITPAGSLGTIPEGIFYQNTMLVTTDPLPNTPTCTATTAGTNVITCTSTEGIYPELFVMFTGTVFGGISPYVEYYVLDVISSTQFRINAAYGGTSPVELTTATGSMTAVFRPSVYYLIIAGSLPAGIQCSANGLIVGIPEALASLQGVPYNVNRDVTSKFTLRAYTENQNETIDRIRDRTFTLTVTGNQTPEFITPAGSIGSYYDGDLIDYQITYTNNDPGDTVIVKLAGGELPGGVSLSPTGLLYGYIKPVDNIDQPPGYDLTPIYAYPYDFVVAPGNNKNYQFTLEVTDGKGSNLRTFQFFVYNRSTLTADTTQITADNTTVTADETTERAPFLINGLPSDLGTVRGDNYYAYQFLGNDYDTPDLKYAIGVNQGYGLPPGLALDPVSGWYYGYIPDQGVTVVDYSFNIIVYQSDFVGDPITCTATEFGTNIITCNSTAQINIGQPIVFTGTSFGGIAASPTQVYYVFSLESTTEFTVAIKPDATSSVALSTAAGSLTANLIVASDPYPFVLEISGAINAEVTWTTPYDLGVIENGATSLLSIQAINVGGRTLQYRLKSGAYNLLPQGLKLLPTGELSGRVTFNTFAIDLGTTTFDATQTVVRNVTIQETTFDTKFTFTVNAYAEDTEQIVYNVSKVEINNGGIGYSSIDTPALEFSTPVGASAVAAQVSQVTVESGTITDITLSNTGAGYTGPATLTILAGYGGSGAVLTPVMRPTGIRDVVSVYKTFTVQVKHTYNKPYQNLSIQAMPPANDRLVIENLLNNEEIFNPEYLYRPNDPYFGKARRVTYQHAFGLAPDMLDVYIESLYLNHYWKNLVLGEINVAQAVDPITGEIVYEVVYSKIIDNLVNNSGASVNKIVNTPYAFVDPADGSTEITQVYPNSLVNMRDQVTDVVGQISSKLPLWMTSKQSDGRILGFTPAWVICYANPGHGAQIAYYIQTQFQNQLNAVDFKVDRYILDHTLSRNWDTVTQNWAPTPTLTTFDRYASGAKPFAGYVDIATRLAYADVNNRTLEYIAELGGLDGQITGINGSTIVFVRQQYYTNTVYATPDEAWQNYIDLYDDTGYSTETSGAWFDESYTIPGGYLYDCTQSISGSDYIKAIETTGMAVNDPVWFSGAVFGGIQEYGVNQVTQVYYVKSIVGVTCTATTAGTNIITCNSTANLANDDIVWFSGNTFGGIDALNASLESQPYYVTVINSTQFKVSLTLGGGFETLSTSSGTMTANTRYFTVSETSADGIPGDVVTLTSAVGIMTADFGNQRMAVYTISVDFTTRLVTLTPTQLTAQSQFVQIQRGLRFAGEQFYYPSAPASGYTLINWLPVVESSVSETIFDESSMKFISPVDTYDPTDRDDKYLVFPKANILV
jgi:hypothetical protein